METTPTCRIYPVEVEVGPSRPRSRIPLCCKLSVLPPMLFPLYDNVPSPVCAWPHRALGTSMQGSKNDLTQLDPISMPLQLEPPASCETPMLCLTARSRPLASPRFPTQSPFLPHFTRTQQEMADAAFERERARLVAETAQEIAAVGAQLRQLNAQLAVIAERGREIDAVATLWATFHARIVEHHTASSEAAAAAGAGAAGAGAAVGAGGAAAGGARPPFT